ncbi:unnamed protein product [Bursaphelenchus xylophilus]|uniref:(pine wood nematode) hypothetical protein n=1 Tax=Bursaphelenchus xylophilus TaxID=6326 RepID=A0A1I7SWC9_BURXY|nr:unnamed protein product [Bursaphelenchus xylophilus]CAG9099211.1 unnamed protein product [Bursaphelenchus xylophilus]
MGFHSFGWKRVLVILSIFFLVLLVIITRQNCYTKINQVQNKLSVCLHHSEALSSQLDVINKYKETVESVLGSVRAENDKTINECKKRVSTLEMVSKNCGNGDEIKKLKEENEELKLKIEQLDSKHKQDQVHAVQNAISEVKEEKKVEDRKDGHEAEKNADNYAKGPDVHFERKRPMNEILEFKRGQIQQEVPVEGWMEHKELVKKLNDRRKEKDDAANVEDFRELAKPDGQEEDYKEMH